MRETYGMKLPDRVLSDEEFDFEQKK